MKSKSMRRSIGLLIEALLSLYHEDPLVQAATATDKEAPNRLKKHVLDLLVFISAGVTSFLQSTELEAFYILRYTTEVLTKQYGMTLTEVLSFVSKSLQADPRRRHRHAFALMGMLPILAPFSSKAVAASPDLAKTIFSQLAVEAARHCVGRLALDASGHLTPIGYQGLRSSPRTQCPESTSQQQAQVPDA